MTVSKAFLRLDPKLQYKLAKKEYERRVSENPSKYYIPNLKLQQFIKVIAEECEKIVNGDPSALNIFILPGGNGCGKSSFLINLISAILFGPQSEYFDYPIFRNWPWPKKGRVVGTSANVEGSPEKGQVGAIQVELKKWLYPRHYTSDKMGKTYSSLYKTDTGHSFGLMTYNQATEEYAGPSLGWIGLDEPPPQGIFDECVARLREGGILFITMTSLREAWWIFQNIEAGAKYYMHPFVDAHDNCKQCGVDGYLEHAHIEKVLEAYIDPDEREARKTGKPMYFTGRKYKLYNPDYHLIHREQAYQMWPDIDYYPMVMSCDPHDRKPFVFIWVKVTPGNDIVVWHEYPNKITHSQMYCMLKDSQLTVRDYAKMIHDFEFGRTITRRLIDPMYVPERVGIDAKSTIIQKFAPFNIIFARGEASQKKRDDAVREYLGLKKRDEFIHEHRRKIYIVNDLINMDWSLKNHVWDEFKDKDNRDQKQKVRDTPAKCFCNCLEYICADYPEFTRIEPTHSPAPEPKIKPPSGRSRGGDVRWV